MWGKRIAGAARLAAERDGTATVSAAPFPLCGSAGGAHMPRTKRGRLSGPDAMAFLNFVMRTDNFASVAQRVRAATTLLEVGEFLASEAKPTGLFRDAEDADGTDGRAA